MWSGAHGVHRGPRVGTGRGGKGLYGLQETVHPDQEEGELVNP